MGTPIIERAEEAPVLARLVSESQRSGRSATLDCWMDDLQRRLTPRRAASDRAALQVLQAFDAAARLVAHLARVAAGHDADALGIAARPHRLLNHFERIEATQPVANR